MKRYSGKSILMLGVIFTVLIASCKSSKQTIKSDLLEMNINGKVLSITEADYTLVPTDGKMVKTEKASQESSLIFNEYGMLVQKKERDYTHDYTNVYDYKFDANNRKIEEVFTAPKNNVKYTTTYKYDDKGNMCESVQTFDTLKKISKYSYDDNNKIKEVKLYDGHNVLRVTEDYKYDSNGNLVELDDQAMNQADDGKITYRYDQNRNIIQIIIFEKDGTVGSTALYSYTYDDKKNWITKTTTFQDTKAQGFLERKISYAE